MSASLASGGGSPQFCPVAGGRSPRQNNTVDNSSNFVTEDRRGGSSQTSLDTR
ncbi:hypothetical protein PISMIDRAFT_683900, partial [Pisolithus microcarpus 441]